MSYPKWMYHASVEDPTLVESEEQEDGLDPGWADSPAAALDLSASSIPARKGPGRPRSPKKSNAKTEEIHA